jgi:hypothetical protein
MGSGLANSPRLNSRKSSRSAPRPGIQRLTRGLAALVIGFGIVPTAMVGAAWALAVSLQARSDIRSATLYLPPETRLTWPGQTAAGMAGDWLPEQSEDSITTASIAPVTYQLAAIDIEAVKGSVGAVALDDAESPPPLALPLPLPRSRPKLAALTPMDGLPSLDPDADAGRTAVYDISARTVYMPNGERLEAHSGIGKMMDDPKFVHVRMRGATPPNTYTLKLRESLFHGVQAIRMTPVNEKQMFGRDGILAHSYLLGSTGQSHGCVAFKDYARFLRAFQRGHVKRMIVVPSLPQPPNFAQRGRNASL